MSPLRRALPCSGRPAILSLLLAIWSAPAAFPSIEVRAEPPGLGDHRVWLHGEPRLVVDEAFVQRISWDLRGVAVLARTSISVVDPREAPRPRALVPDPAWVAARAVRDDAAGGPRTADYVYYDPSVPSPHRWAAAAWSTSGGTSETARRPLAADAIPASLRLGDRFTERTLLERLDGTAAPTLHTEHVEVVAEGIVITFAGPREAVLLRVREHDDRPPMLLPGPEDGRRVSYRWVANAQGEVAMVVGPEGSWEPYFAAPQAVTVLGGTGDAPQGIQIHKASMPLSPRTLFLAQYYSPTNPTNLTAIDPEWTTAGAMVADTAARVDPQTGASLAETWDFMDAATDPAVNDGFLYATFTQDVLVQVRDETTAGGCSNPTFCTAYAPPSPTPPNGTWQYYLKFDFWNRALPPAMVNRDLNFINDNDATQPSLDITLISQSERTSAWQQICFDAGPNILARYLKFNTGGPNWEVHYDDGSDVNDRWTTTGWTDCTSGAGLAIRDGATGCNAGGIQAYARSRGCNQLPDYGLDFLVVEDGYVRARTGNIVPALLVRQHTALRASILGGCPLLFGQDNNNFDYWWFSEQYGILARVSSTTGCGLSATGFTQTDGVYVTMGLFPPRQVTAASCVGRVRLDWLRPQATDTERFVDSWNVYWGATPGAKTFTSGPLPKTQTSYEITTNLSSPTYASVVSTYAYADPDLSPDVTYESPLSYNVAASPLPGGTFLVGNTQTATASPPHVALAWGAVAGAASYGVYRDTQPSMATQSLIGGPAGTAWSDPVLGDGATYYYRVLAVDACGQLSTY